MAIQRQYRGHVEQYNSSAETITLKEFFLSIRDNPSEHVNLHWRPLTHSNCGFCSFQYDFILKLETASEEIAFVYRKANGDVDLPRPLPRPRDKFSDDQKWLQLRNVPYNLLHETLKNVYNDDYQAFDYEIPSQNFYNHKISQLWKSPQ